MSVETNKELVREFYKAIQRGEFDSLGSFCAEQFVFYNQVDTPRRGLEGFIAAERASLEAMDDLTLSLDHLVAEGDLVAAYIVLEGIHARPAFGVEPHGARVRTSLLNLFVVRDGKFVEKRAHYDRMDVVLQMEAPAR